MANEANGQACDLTREITPLPADPVPGMAYVPFQQWDTGMLTAERALDAGTLFTVMDKPFYGRRGMMPRSTAAEAAIRDDGLERRLPR